MLSINIPVFNIEVNDLVLQLVQQAEKTGVSYEIRVYDDGSGSKTKNVNRKLRALSKVKYIELKNNIGRAAIRNKMGIESKYEYILFIDADSKVIKDDYLAVYLAEATSNYVLCGGTTYQKEKPVEKEKVLRWMYGTKREAVLADMRNSKKGFIITSNNFLISKKVFEQVHFRESIRNYGHEDTVLGYDLFKKGIEIRHIDNPVEHIGLEDAEVFLNKSKTALENLKYISEKILENDKDFINQVYFLRRFYSIIKWLPSFFLRLYYSIFRSVLERNFKGKNPRMSWFDSYKLGYFSTITKP